ncbi:MAG: rRNA (cytidine1402-2-O)-methyltransferase [Actinomycetota bacterium]|jgi:16S rRNA (cytidine1402-2'-O)-methyltransferase|nr:rRNA (cytidine1402-2-O)-methyltransferase [Actinomycetota bacterium]
MSTGALVLVATPIGNLGDLSERAVAALRDADVVAAEDTRRTRALLSHLGISGGGRLRAIHGHNERSEARRVVELVASGKQVVYVSDAGTPGIADPGERLVRACIDADLPVGMVPGPSAALAALVLSGLPTSRFRFEGFLPRKGGGRAERIADIADADSTVVLYESPHRIVATLQDLLDALGPDRAVAVARELTKLFEEVIRGPLGDIAAQVNAASAARGEHVIVVGPAARNEHVDDDTLTQAVTHAIVNGASARDAAATVARDLGIPRRRAYDAALRVRAKARN